MLPTASATGGPTVGTAATAPCTVWTSSRSGLRGRGTGGGGDDVVVVVVAVFSGAGVPPCGVTVVLPEPLRPVPRGVPPAGDLLVAPDAPEPERVAGAADSVAARVRPRLGTAGRPPSSGAGDPAAATDMPGSSGPRVSWPKPSSPPPPIPEATATTSSSPTGTSSAAPPARSSAASHERQ